MSECLQFTHWPTGGVYILHAACTPYINQVSALCDLLTFSAAVPNTHPDTPTLNLHFYFCI